ncbi:MAG TPA: GNAT family N-acetyltransferase [Actinomycetota bacterium]|nr:GNAT family N-acetyltransferase [Actinomycetota bacterium]
MGRPPSGGPIPEAVAPAGVEIRPARRRDAAGILEVRRELAAEERFIRTEVVSESVRDTRARLARTWTREAASIVAVADRRVVGHLGVARELQPVTAHVASLGMGVTKALRRRGVGAALLAEAFRWARWAGVEKLALSVYPENEPALRLYERFGFVEEGLLTGHSKKATGYRDELVMARWL